MRIGTSSLAGGKGGSGSGRDWVAAWDVVWLLWALFTLALTFGGALSMIRPAADVFVAGFTEAFPSMYFVAVWFANANGLDAAALASAGVPTSARPLLLLAMLLNMPLIVLYPLTLSHFPSVPLGTVNASLHCWLTVAWGLQWWTLKQYCAALGPRFQQQQQQQQPNKPKRA